jgi:hypothetical protein
MTLALVLARAAKRNALIYNDIVANLGRLADYHARAVVDEHSPTYFRGGMYLDTRKFFGVLRNNPRN